MVFEKTPESPFDCKEIQPVHPKGNQSWDNNASARQLASAALFKLSKNSLKGHGDDDAKTD